MEKTYNVILRKGADFQSFHNDMTTITNLDGIPNREVVSPDERPGSKRQGWYSLTEEEVELVKAHQDVIEVEIPPEQRDDIQIVKYASQTGNFDRLPTATADDLNWGLLRHIEDSLNWASNDRTGTYTYNNSGEGVDVVIQDSGIQHDHPDFNDADGNTRVQNINWATESGLSFTQHANHNRDLDGHGTHVCGIAAGTRYGWAKNARIFSQKVAGLEGTGDSGTGIAASNALDAIKLWHRNKPTGSNGLKRPTVVNMSWGYGTGFSANATVNINFRGALTSSANSTQRAAAGLNVWSSTDTWYTNVRIASVDTDVEEMVDEGIVVCVAAGNRNLLIAESGDKDYNNTVASGGTTRSYHRGSSPYHAKAIIVGSIGPYELNNKDHRSSFTNHGPGVDIYAVGSNIMSAMSSQCRSTFSTGSYPHDSDYSQGTLQGTSQASPQVAGVCALMLSANPGATPAEIKRSLIANATNDWDLDESTTALNSTNATHDANAKMMLYTQASKEEAIKIEGGLISTANISFN